MTLIQRNHEVQAFPPDCSDQSFTEGIRLRSFGRSLEGSHSERGNSHTEFRGERRMSIVNKEPVSVIAGYRFSKLLNRPFATRMRGHIAVENATRANLHHEQHMTDAETSCENRGTA